MQKGEPIFLFYEFSFVLQVSERLHGTELESMERPLEKSVQF